MEASIFPLRGIEELEDESVLTFYAEEDEDSLSVDLQFMEDATPTSCSCSTSLSDAAAVFVGRSGGRGTSL